MQLPVKGAFCIALSCSKLARSDLQHSVDRHLGFHKLLHCNGGIGGDAGMASLGCKAAKHVSWYYMGATPPS